MADQGHYRAEGGTRQGIYVLSAAGTFLTSVNSLDANAVYDTLQTGLAAWQKLDAGARSVIAEKATEAEGRWERVYPRDGLVLRTYVRDLPSDFTASGTRLPRHNRDHAWFSAEEAAAIVPKRLEAGSRIAWPPHLVHRLVAFHLNDNVRGQCLPFAPEEVRGSELWTEVRSAVGRRVELLVMGVGHALGDDTWRMGENDWKPKGSLTPRGVDTRILGRATFDRESNRFVEWDMVAIGRWHGHSGVNGRHPTDSGHLGVSLGLAPPDAYPIPPAFIDVYDADWTRRL